MLAAQLGLALGLDRSTFLAKGPRLLQVLAGVRQRRVCWQLRNLISPGWMWHPNRPYTASLIHISTCSLRLFARFARLASSGHNFNT